MGSSLACGFAYWSGTTALAEQPAASPNEQPIVGFTGTGIRYHSALGRGATNLGPCAAICDVDMVQAGRAYQVDAAQHNHHNDPIDISIHENYRHLLENKEIDVVVIATTDHWHSKIVIMAMQAGKDVYCEKPLTLNISLRLGRKLTFDT